MSFTLEAPPACDGDHDINPFAGEHHARYIRPDVPYHVISRVFQSRHLLRPCKRLNRVILGVLGRALHVYPDVRLYAYAFMSNHMHLAMQGPTAQFAAFIGFVKREISRRWGGDSQVGWSGTMWHEYMATALPTEESQLACLKYILSQGVKEGLVAKPQLWPGVHCARQLMAGSTLKGEWLDATSYCRARDIAVRCKQRQAVRQADFVDRYDVTLHPLPCWSELNEVARRRRVGAFVDEITREGAAARAGTSPVGAKAVMAVPMERRTSLPALPWFEGRRRMVCWAETRRAEVRAYLDAYWRFQRAFRGASTRWLRDGSTTDFPVGAFIPTMLARILPEVVAASA